MSNFQAQEPADLANAKTFQKAFLILLLSSISILFIVVVRGFLIALLLAAIFSSMVKPLYARLSKLTSDRNKLSSLLTVLLISLTILIPLASFFLLVASQSIAISESVGPWIEEQLSDSNETGRWFERVIFLEPFSQYEEEISKKLGELVTQAGTLLFEGLKTITTGTLSFFFQLFIMLYAMYFFLLHGDSVLRKILYYMPLGNQSEKRLLNRLVSVSRATIKGVLVVGAIQGLLGGAAFAVLGIPNAAFWGTLMAVFSIIPALGTGIVWVPATLYLIASGSTTSGIILGLWCAAVVGTVDNLLRPWLVGKDAQIPDLLILITTLGGIFLFGIVGFILGPVIAALFVTVWEIYGLMFRNILPEVKLDEVQ